MPPTTPHSGNELDRKSLKRPDNFSAALRAFFDGLAHHWQAFLAGLAVLFLIGVSVTWYMNHSAAKENKARGALFLANNAVEKDLLTVAKALEPATPAVAPTGAKDKNEVTPEALLDKVAHKKIDVDGQLADGVAKLKAVAQEHKGTRAAFEARLGLADLYYNHGEPTKAVEWYGEAAKAAPGHSEKAMALYGLGYAHENSGKPAEAIKAYEQALNLGEAGLKGDLLLATARCYEMSHDVAKARSTYDRILSQLPNTEHAKSAETLKARLQ